MENQLVCPECGKTGERTGGWVRPGMAAGDLMTGLDPEECVGCWDVMAKHGIAPGILTTGADGDQKWVPIPRSVPEQKAVS